MPDFLYCTSDRCPIKQHCARYADKMPDGLSFRWNRDRTCDFFFAKKEEGERGSHSTWGLSSKPNGDCPPLNVSSESILK